MRRNPEQGFRLLMAGYKEPLYWHIRRLVVSHADAQDAAQARNDVSNAKADYYFMDSDQLAVRLQKAIHSLPLKQQLTFNLRYYDELSYEEIAEVTGSSAASAKMNYHLAKDKIIKLMNSND